MEEAYAIALLISIFCHQTNLFFNPIEATMGSSVFIFLTLMTFNKINRQNLDYNPYSSDVREKILQFLTLCITVQVLLVIAWFPLSIIVHYLVNMACHDGTGERDWLVKLVQDNAASFILMALESFALYVGFEMRDLQRFFGSKDDCLSKSVISMVKKQYDRVLKREKRNQRRSRRR
ncbi:hypothetical protein KR074_002670 [Drosophila pseudoananassae]|nr:hypothetical protein KR074_002670 [Drosophila pseudoananassae]